MGKTNANFEIEEFFIQFAIGKTFLVICIILFCCMVFMTAVIASQITEKRMIESAKNQKIAELEERIERLEAKPQNVFNTNVTGRNPFVNTTPLECSIVEDVERIRFD